MTEHSDWQRKTALSKVERLREEARASGTPMSDERMARAAAGYVDTTTDQGAALDAGRGMSEAIRLVEGEADRLPHNIEAEAALLGALMLPRGPIDAVADILAPAHFYEPLHSRIYEQILTLNAENKTVSPVSLRPYFDADEAMNEIGGPAYLLRLTDYGEMGRIGALDFARQVLELARLREIFTIGRDMADAALDTSTRIDSAAIITEMEDAVAAVVEIDRGGRSSMIGSAVEDWQRGARRRDCR